MMKKIFLSLAPVWLQNLVITIYNTSQYRQRHGGIYQEKRRYFEKAEKLTPELLLAEHENRLKDFLSWSSARSNWYKKVGAVSNLYEYPVLEKSDLLSQLDSIATINEHEAIVSLTGGTTGV